MTDVCVSFTDAIVRDHETPNPVLRSIFGHLFFYGISFCEPGFLAYENGKDDDHHRKGDG
jgi:hypothetical protein